MMKKKKIKQLKTKLSSNKVKKVRKSKTGKKIIVAEKVDTKKKQQSLPLNKNDKLPENMMIEQQERDYKFDERLVPYWLGGDTKEGNLAIRNALIKLGKTSAMTDLFDGIKVGNLSYREDAMEVFIKALVSVIKGFDSAGLLYINENDIELIHANNLKMFNEYWDAKTRVLSPSMTQFDGFDN